MAITGKKGLVKIEGLSTCQKTFSEHPLIYTTVPYITIPTLFKHKDSGDARWQKYLAHRDACAV